MMRTGALILLFGCSDYDLHGHADNTEPLDTGVMTRPDDPVVTTPDPTTTTTPPALSGPVAVCEVDPPVVNPPYQSVTWDGWSSYDTDGLEIVTYKWEIVSRPDGSNAQLTGDGARQVFYPDLVGEYIGQLTVKNSAGMWSEPCEAVLTSEPTQDLWIEMFWQHSGDDMDLHLLKPGGNLESNGDCYFGNCVGGGPDWGVSGDYEDNPRLDLDDIPGTGPENININEPASGVYKVVVHDYPGSQYSGANDVTINIYLGGALEWTGTQTISGENSYNYFAEIDWDAQAVTAL